MDSAGILIAIVTGIASSIVASLIVTLSLYNLRPRIEVSPVIARGTRDGRPEYMIKVINKTRTSIIDIQTTLIMAAPADMPGGKSYRYEYLKMRTEDMFSINGFDKKDTDATYAILFIAQTDLDTVWTTEGTYLIFNIMARHSFSGFSRSIQTSYHSRRGSIVTGSFKHGNCLDVVAGA